MSSRLYSTALSHIGHKIESISIPPREIFNQVGRQPILTFHTFTLTLIGTSLKEASL